MLYYPGFEAQDINWLKFAMLYLDELRPIIPDIPYNQSTYLSSHTIEIMNETNFIRPYRPDYHEGEIASQCAIADFDAYMRNPRAFNIRYIGSYRNAALLTERWQRPKLHNYTLYNGKFSHDFYEYCLSRNIASECDEGIKVHEHVACIYMSLLSEQISLAYGFEAITDCPIYDELLISRNTRIGQTCNQEFRYATNNIKVYLPTNIERIPLAQIIKLRSSDSFNQLRQAYVNQIKNLILAKENKNAGYPLEDLLRYEKDFLGLCTSSFGALSSITLTAHDVSKLMTGTIDTSTFVTVAEIYGGINLLSPCIKNAIHSMKNMKNKKLARKYLATLKQLPKM